MDGSVRAAMQEEIADRGDLEPILKANLRGARLRKLPPCPTFPAIVVYFRDSSSAGNLEMFFRFEAKVIILLTINQNVAMML
jgi:hypothetical protein